jgi:hypothetical protein
MKGPGRQSFRRIAAFVGTVACFALIVASAQAATFTVGTTSDTAPGVTCSGFPNGCSLRQLIEHENTLPAAGPADTIVVPAGSYTLTNGELLIEQNLTIAGAGARTTMIEQNPPVGTPVARVFDVQPNGFTPAVTISGLEMFFGKATSGSPNGNEGGNILNEGTLTLSEDWITNGQTTGGSGAGVANVGGTLTVTHSLLEDNLSFAASGSGGEAGGIDNLAARDTTARLAVDNSTLVSNTAAGGVGAIWSRCQVCVASSTTITNSTITGNDGGTATPNAGGLVAGTGSTISVLNSIVASNTVSTGATASNCSGGALITSLGRNLETATDCGFTAAGDLQNTNPKFLTGGVSDNGGNTDTITLDVTSPAVDAIPANAPGCTGTDQRDVARPQGTGCDIGAFEALQPVEGQQFSEVIRQIDGTSGTINWGDGTSSAAAVDSLGQASGTHTYAHAGIYSCLLTWRNSDGGTSQAAFQVKVTDAPLTASGSELNAIIGKAFTGQVASLTDGNPLASASDYAVTINWGDGTSSSVGTVSAGPGGFVINGTHTYSSIGTYATTISIADDGGASTVAHGIASAGLAPTSVLTGAPSVSATGAGFSGSANPNGLPTSAVFQYGLDPKYFGGGPVVYTNATPAQNVGSDFASHNVTATVSGLVPNALYHVRLAATNSAGTTFGPDVTFTTSHGTTPGSPALGRTFNISLVSGVILVKVNGQFVPLTELTQIPKNTVIDALHGTLTLTSAGGSPPGARDAAAKGKKPKKTSTQKGTFGGAIFKVSQATKGAGKGLVTLAIVEGAAVKGAPSYSLCTKHKATDPSARAASVKTLQLLHASAKGKFRTKGKYSAATVLGTKWTVADRCDGTLTHDITDSVAVNDFVHHKTIILHAGQSYLAKARK